MTKNFSFKRDKTTIAKIYLVWYFYYKAEKSVGKFLPYACANFAVEAGIILFFLSNILDLPVVGILFIAFINLIYIAPYQNLLKAIKEKNTN